MNAEQQGGSDPCVECRSLDAETRDRMRKLISIGHTGLVHGKTGLSLFARPVLGRTLIGNAQPRARTET